MKRPKRIPTDVWEKLTVNEAASAGLLGSVPAEWLIVGGSALLCGADDTAMVASMLRENISNESVARACALVRLRMPAIDALSAGLKGLADALADAGERMSANLFGVPKNPVELMTRPARIPEDVWETLTIREAVEAELLGEPALERVNPETLCRTLKHNGTLAACLRSNIDNRHLNIDEIVAARIERIREARRQSCGPVEYARAVASVFGVTDNERARMKRERFAREVQQLEQSESTTMKRPTRIPGDIWDRLTIGIAAKVGMVPPSWVDIVSSDVLFKFIEEQMPLAQMLEQWNRTNVSVESALKHARQLIADDEHEDGEADTPTPEPSPVITFREDICPNNQPLLPPYVIHVPVPGGGRATITMGASTRYPPGIPCVECSVTGDSLAVHFFIVANDPHTVRLGVGSLGSGATRRNMARNVLVFDRAVRLGEEDAVSAYGLILFALAVRREHDRTETDRMLASADAAMDAVMSTTRTLAESERN
jgi:hypothetical protein